MAMEEEEMKLQKEDKELEEELKEYQDKHKQVKLVYEKVFENIKGICKLDKKKIEEVQNSSINNSIDNSNELDVSQNVIKVVGPSEEEVSKHFIEYLENTRIVIERLYLTVGRKEFQTMLKDRGVDTGSSASKNKEKLTKANKKNVNDSKSPSNTAEKANIHTNQEYDYSDEELKDIKTIATEILK